MFGRMNVVIVGIIKHLQKLFSGFIMKKKTVDR